LGSDQWTGRNYIDPLNDLQQTPGGFLHLSFSSLGERPERVILARSGKLFGVFGDTVPDD
jgi:hypothetical protein